MSAIHKGVWCAADNHNYVCHMCKRIFRFEAVIDKISNFHKIAPNFKYSQKLQFLKYH